MADPELSNQLLASLPARDFDLLAASLSTRDLELGAVLFEADEPVERVYFPHSGIISLVVALADGHVIETSMIGRDGAVGGSAAMGHAHSLNRAMVQVPGIASSAPVQSVRSAAEGSVALRDALARNEQALLVQAQQSAACNASHPLEGRLARWLLRSRDLAGDILPMTQEFLAEMLGVRRTSVTLVASALQQAGLITYKRGRIAIANPEGLRAASCECYEAVKTRCDRLVNDPSQLTTTGS
jgi:CRP-like cAMP-binding protein